LPPLVALDEMQKTSMLLDSVQDLINRGIARFLLTGSSARKLPQVSMATHLCFWRDADGQEVDWLIDQDGIYTPFEVK
jgi:hypothetical protein